MKTDSKVYFQNQPKLSNNSSDKKFNERKTELLPYIQDFISNHYIFKDKEVKITFFPKGVSSLVCILETKEEKSVLKIPLSLEYSRGEPLFFETWQHAGVKVPKIIEEGKINGLSYFLMEYIDAKKLVDAYSNEELIDKGVYFKMGQTLHIMHTPKSTGYGHMVNEKAEYTHFKDWVNNSKMQQLSKYLDEHKLVSPSFSEVSEILTDFIDQTTESSYCHEDFGIHNIFDTTPLTVFDSNPLFSHPYIDLGYSLPYLIERGAPLDSFINGYFSSEEHNRKFLTAAIFLGIYVKLPRAYETNQTERIKHFKEFLSENKHLLES